MVQFEMKAAHPSAMLTPVARMNEADVLVSDQPISANNGADTPPGSPQAARTRRPSKSKSSETFDEIIGMADDVGGIDDIGGMVATQATAPVPTVLLAHVTSTPASAPRTIDSDAVLLPAPTSHVAETDATIDNAVLFVIVLDLCNRNHHYSHH